MRTKIRQRATYLFIVLIALIVLWYGFIGARKLIFGPQIALETPQDGAVVHEALVSITGTALRTQELYINDRLVLIEEDGAFTDELLIAPGYSILALTAVDRFGRRETMYVRLTRDAPHITSMPPATTTTSTATTTHGAEEI